MPTTYEAIATVTVGSGGAASISFSSIPNTFTDIVIKLSARNSASANKVTAIRFNGDSGANYSYRVLQGNGSATASFTQTLAANYDKFGFCFAADPDYTANTFANSEIYIPNYAGSTNKSFSVDTVTENNATGSLMGIAANLWSNTAAITSITLLPDPNGAASNFVQHSTATLYGIKNS